MRWSEVIADKSLQNLLYKIELNEYGKIEMSPATNRHSYYQSKIDRLLGELHVVQLKQLRELKSLMSLGAHRNL